MSKEKADAYLEIAELWLKNSYESDSFPRMAFSKMKFRCIATRGSKLHAVEFEGKFDFDYLWDSKKEVREVKNGKENIIKMNGIEWRKMLKYERKHHIESLRVGNNGYSTLPQSEITKLYKLALAHQKSI